jgi:hypothetical protein
MGNLSTNVSPKEVSRTRLWETRKVFSKADPYKIRDILDDHVITDKFKDYRDFTKKPEIIPNKITQISHYKTSSNQDFAPKIKSVDRAKFSSREVKFRGKKSKPSLTLTPFLHS